MIPLACLHVRCIPPMMGGGVRADGQTKSNRRPLLNGWMWLDGSWTGVVLLRPNHLVVFDAKPGGTGVMRAAFEYGARALVDTALKIATSCGCKEGCPGCILDTACKEHNQVVSKQAATIILQSICDTLKGTHGPNEAPLEQHELEPGVAGGAGFFTGNEWVDVAGTESHIITAYTTN